MFVVIHFYTAVGHPGPLEYWQDINHQLTQGRAWPRPHRIIQSLALKSHPTWKGRWTELTFSCCSSTPLPPYKYSCHPLTKREVKKCPVPQYNHLSSFSSRLQLNSVRLTNVSRDYWDKIILHSLCWSCKPISSSVLTWLLVPRYTDHSLFWLTLPHFLFLLNPINRTWEHPPYNQKIPPYLQPLQVNWNGLSLNLYCLSYILFNVSYVFWIEKW